MSGRIYLSPPDVGPLEERYVLDALRSGWVAPVGPDLDAFEAELAERTGVAHAVAVGSGTAALHLALLGLGVGPGQVVVVPTLTFVATANAVVYTGAEPVFVDCEPATGNLDADLLADLLGRLRSAGRRVGAVIPVDLFGRCADYAAILPLCADHDVPVVEDAAESLGATYRGRAGRLVRAGGGVVVQRQQDHDHVRRRRAAVRRRRLRRPVPLSGRSGPPAGRALRAHRGRLQLPAQQPARRAGPGAAAAARRDDGPSPRAARPVREAVRGCRRRADPRRRR